MFLTLAGFLVGPVLMLLVCCAVCLLVMVTQFLFIVPLLVPVILPLLAIFIAIDSKESPNSFGTSEGLEVGPQGK